MLRHDFRNDYRGVTVSKRLQNEEFSIYTLYELFGISSHSLRCAISFDSSAYDNEKVEIGTVEVEKKFETEINNDPYSQEPIEYDSSEFEELKFISQIDFPDSIDIFIDGDGIEHSILYLIPNSELEILSIDYSNKKIVYSLKIENRDNHAHLDYGYMKIDGLGLTEEEYDGLEIWQAVLIQSYSTYSMGFKDEAFMSAFSALDTLIESLRNTLNELSKEYVNCKMDDLIGERQRLIKEKFKTILSIFDCSLEDRYVSDIYNKMLEFEEDRNNLAHANVTGLDDDKYLDLLECIIKFIELIYLG